MNKEQGFIFSKEENNKILAWKKQHRTKFHSPQYKESYEYSFIPTSGGIISSCYCIACYNRILKQAYQEEFEAKLNHKSFNFEERFAQLLEKNDIGVEFQSIDLGDNKYD